AGAKAILVTKSTAHLIWLHRRLRKLTLPNDRYACDNKRCHAMVARQVLCVPLCARWRDARWTGRQSCCSSGSPTRGARSAPGVLEQQDDQRGSYMWRCRRRTQRGEVVVGQVD